MNLMILKNTEAGIRLHYTSYTPALEGIKEGILLEAGFDVVAPNQPIDIASWILGYVKSSAQRSIKPIRQCAFVVPIRKSP